MKVFFNSSLPRSGSTLVQNILAQNPRFHCSPTSGVLELLYGARQNFTTLDEFKMADQAAMKRGWLEFCKSGLEGFYRGVTNRPVAVDKSRGWMYFYEWLSAFYPNPKIICCVRDPRAIISSMEKLHRRNMHLHDPADQPAQMKMVSLESRVSHWLTSAPVGLGLERLRDAVNKNNASKFFIIQYDSLTCSPETVFKRLYQYLDEPEFEHDFLNVEQLVVDNDAMHGVYGDHKIGRSVKCLPKDWEAVLGKSVSDQINEQFGWVTTL